MANTPSGPSRRTLLTTAALTGLALAGCTIDTSSRYGNGSQAEAIDLPDYGGTPAGDVTFRWVDSGDLKSVFIEAVLEAYADQHPNVSTSYDGGGWDQVAQVVPLGIRNGSAHDIFALPQDIPAQVAIREGWVQPLDDIVPEFARWRSVFPDTAFVPGVHVFDGLTYSFPLNSVRRLDRMLFFDAAVMAEAGYEDPAAEVTSWEEMRTAARAVAATDRSGLVLASDGLAGVVTFLAMTAGWPAPVSGLDSSTGRYVFDAPEMVAAVELLLAMIDDGSVTPGFLTLLEKDARAQMPGGRAGMILNGPWDIPAWKQSSPDWDYVMAAPPSPGGDPYVLHFTETGANMTWVYAQTPNPEIAGQVVAYMGSVAGQRAMVTLSEGNLVSTLPEANEQAGTSGLLDENAQRAATLATELMRAAPQVELRNPDSGLVRLELEPVQPALPQILQGIVSGELTDVQRELTAYNDAMDAALDAAITAAAAKGATVTREDYVFANWDPASDYTAADYEALR